MCPPHCCPDSSALQHGASAGALSCRLLSSFMQGLILRQCQYLIVCQQYWRHIPHPPELPFSPGAARIKLVHSRLCEESTVDEVNHP